MDVNQGSRLSRCELAIGDVGDIGTQRVPMEVARRSDSKRARISVKLIVYVLDEFGCK